MNKQPPKYPLRFFRWFCNKDCVEDIEGDLLERFEKRTNEQKAAGWLLTLDVLRLFRPGIIQPFEGTQKLNYYGMLKHNIKISWRNALRQKQFTILNLLGLSIGIATALVISLFITDELSYDSFHRKGDRIYRVNQSSIWGNWEEWMAGTGPNVAVALREDAPEFEEVTRLLSVGAQTLRITQDGNNAYFKERFFHAAEENFLDVFSFDLIAGDPAQALKEPDQLILTQETAKRLFSEETNPHDLIGRELSVKAWDGTWQVFSVSAIARDVPTTSHIQFDILASLSSYQEQMDRDGWKWIWTGFSTYGLVHEHTDVAALEEKIQLLPPKWAPPTTERIFNQSFEEFTAGHPWKLGLQPLSEIYISGEPDFHFFGRSGNPLFVQIFGAIGILVLILSAINFMNLSTARSSLRSKEVGVRKVLGSARHQLIRQFSIESILYVLVSTILALIIVSLSIGWFNEMSFKEMSLNLLLESPVSIGFLILFVIFLGLLAGCYPAFYLSAFQPIHALKGQSSQGFKGRSLRNILVVFQFSISIALIICSSFVQKQMSYASSYDLGYEKENILQIHNIEQFGFDTKTLKSSLASTTGVRQIGKSFGIPPNIWSGDRYKAVGGDGQVFQLGNVRTEEDYLDLLDLEFVAGRNFDRSRPADKYKVIINETASRLIGWGDATSFSENSPVGKKIALASGNEDEFEVIGVVKDFNFNSIKTEIRPLIIIHHQNDVVWDYGAGMSYFSLRLDSSIGSTPDDLINIIDNVEATLAAVDPSVPFEFSFLDEDFDRMFRFEQKMSAVLNLFTIMALIIGCLGLFGLAAFSAEQRTKELGIRKVLGASTHELIFKFSSEFTRLVVISIVIASPLAWYLTRQWLEEFAYSTPMEIWVFAAATFGAILIAFLTVGYQAIVTANKNPAETLKDE